ncbi:MAG TPA: HAD family phosphatase [Candidatus Microsaccharimonas sp.]|nr:HAD family phosphatase [Candidatus Microsaccharimonas sp.]
MIQAVVFDFFDVIHKDHQKAWLAANGYKREGGFAEASDLLDRGQITFDEYLERYGKLSGKTPEQVRREFADFALVDKPVVELIEQLRQTHRTALVSNAHSNELRPILEQYDLERLFDEICISSEVGMAKPDPEIFEHIAGLLKLEPAQCVFTDDNLDNVTAATEVGMHGIVFTGVDSLQAGLQQLEVLAA